MSSIMTANGWQQLAPKVCIPSIPDSPSNGMPVRYVGEWFKLPHGDGYISAEGFGPMLKIEEEIDLLYADRIERRGHDNMISTSDDYQEFGGTYDKYGVKVKVF